MIIADENISPRMMKMIENSGYEVYSITSNHQGMPDIDIIDIIKSLNGIFITEDKDFGELVYAYHIKNISVAFLRYNKEDFDKVMTNLLEILNKSLRAESS